MKLKGYLRLQNNAFTATHFHQFINFYLSFILFAFDIKGKCRIFAIRGNFGRTSNLFFSLPTHTYSFKYILPLILRLIKTCHSFSKTSLVSNKKGLEHFKTKVLADNSTKFRMNEAEPMPTESIYLSSDEDTEIQYVTSNQEIANYND